jgi:hypothetical protein
LMLFQISDRINKAKVNNTLIQKIKSNHPMQSVN